MDYKKNYELWLNAPALSEAEKAELAAIAGDEKEIESRFFSQLEFGTAGLRGTMGVGLYRMNIHVIRHATQAFAKVILNEGPESVKKGVAICFDCRNNSDVFAREAACIMAAAGIPVRLFASLRPTPELSFAIREYGCIAGINITASHNPKEYNGYKVYWSDGAQLPPNHADQVAKIMGASDVFDVKAADYDQAVADGLITIMGEETDEKFLANVMAQVNDQAAVDAVADTFKMVYTPFHGTGYKLIPEALKRLGMKHVICVPEQMVIDGNFPTVASPNPENPEGFALAVELANKEGADFILGSDPDADRVGLMVRAGDGFKVLTGNQTGVLLLDYLIGAKQRTGKMPANPVALKTIVTTEMARKVAEVNGLACFDTFTGFKFLAQKKDQLENSGQGNVIMAYEESYGYMLGSYVRDKDAVTAAGHDRDGGVLRRQGHDPLRRPDGPVREVRRLRRAHPEPGDARPGRAEEDGGADVRPAGQSPQGDRRRERQDLEGLQGRQRGGRGHRGQDPDGAVRLQRAALRAGGRHVGHRAALRHRAQGEGVHTGPGGQPAGLR